MKTIVDCDRDAGVRINNSGVGIPQGEPLSVTLPARLIWSADVVLREMTMRGATSPELVIRREKIDGGQSMFHATYGGISAWGVTAWAALERLGKAVEDLWRGT